MDPLVTIRRDVSVRSGPASKAVTASRSKKALELGILARRYRLGHTPSGHTFWFLLVVTSLVLSGCSSPIAPQAPNLGAADILQPPLPQVAVTSAPDVSDINACIEIDPIRDGLVGSESEQRAQHTARLERAAQLASRKLRSELSAYAADPYAHTPAREAARLAITQRCSALGVDVSNL